MEVIRSLYPVYQPWALPYIVAFPTPSVIGRNGLIMGQGAAKLISSTYRDSPKWFAKVITEASDTRGFWGHATAWRRYQVNGTKQLQGITALQVQRGFDERPSVETAEKTLERYRDEVILAKPNLKFALCRLPLPESLAFDILESLNLPGNVTYYAGKEDQLPQ